MIKRYIAPYLVELYVEHNYSPDSMDNSMVYDHVYLDCSDREKSTKIGIKVLHNDSLVASSLIGSTSGSSNVHETSHILLNDRILICCAEMIYCLSLPDLKKLWKSQGDMSNCFQIFTYQDDYIIHGELEISRIDRNGKRIWQRSGKDIFSTLDGTNNFVLNDSFIEVIDWEFNNYRFDYNGNNIE